MKAWLKGGLILSVLYLILGIIIINIPCNRGEILGGPCLGYGILLLFISTPGLGILSILNLGHFSNPVLTIIVNFIIYFIIGAIIGLVVGKIKQKKGVANE